MSLVIALQAIIVIISKITYVTSLFKELNIKLDIPIIYSDNLKAVLLARNPIMSSRTKHFKLDIYFFPK